MFISYEQVVAGTTVKTVDDLTVPAGASGAELQSDTNDIRYTMDGTDPTQTTGMVLLKGDFPKEFSSEELTSIKFTRGTTADANLNVHYVGRNRTITPDPGNVYDPIKIDFLDAFPRTEAEWDREEESESSASSSSTSSVTSSSSHSSHSSSSYSSSSS
jgi:hypothetical protein